MSNVSGFIISQRVGESGSDLITGNSDSIGWRKERFGSSKEVKSPRRNWRMNSRMDDSSSNVVMLDMLMRMELK